MSDLCVFGVDLHEAATRRPTVEVFKGREDPRFGRMLSLKKDLLPGICTSRNARPFK